MGAKTRAGDHTQRVKDGLLYVAISDVNAEDVRKLREMPKAVS